MDFKHLLAKLSVLKFVYARMDFLIAFQKQNIQREGCLLKFVYTRMDFLIAFQKQNIGEGCLFID